jgi:uncharacterized protein (DUF2126 family)
MATKDSVLRGPKDVLTKTRRLAITQTTAFIAATLPKGSRIIGFCLRGVNSNAVTTATVSIGNTSAANQYVNGADVKTAAAGIGPTWLASVSGSLGPALTVDTPIWFKYADTGGAASLGGWYIDIVFTTGNVTNDDTV